MIEPKLLTEEHIAEIQRINDEAREELRRHQEELGITSLEIAAWFVPIDHIEELLAHITALSGIISDQRSDSGLYELGKMDEQERILNRIHEADFMFDAVEGVPSVVSPEGNAGIRLYSKTVKRMIRGEE